MGKQVVAPIGTLSPYAEKMPKMKHTSDCSEKLKRERYRQCGMKVVDFMLRMLSSSVEIWTSIQSNFIVDTDPQPQSSGALVLHAST